MVDIKKVNQRIYEFDLKNCELEDGNELITDQVNEFVNTFIKRDLDKGIMVTPSGYTKGLVYKSTNNGEVYNKAEWAPDIVKFSFNVFGLKKNAFYRIMVIGRNTHKYNRLTDITDDRTLEVSDDNQELLINENLENDFENKQYCGIFRATSNEMNLFFRIGKIYINNIIIDEVVLMSEDKEEDEIPEVSLEEGKSQIKAYGVFSTIPDVDDPEHFRGRYLLMSRLTGKGINLYYDKTTSEYIIERDNNEDTLNSSLTGIDFIININVNKVVNYKKFSGYRIVEVSPDISPNTLKQGFVKFVFVDKDENVVKFQNDDGRIAITVTKIY